MFHSRFTRTFHPRIQPSCDKKQISFTSSFYSFASLASGSWLAQILFSISCQAQPLLFMASLASAMRAQPSLCVSRQAKPLRFATSPASAFRGQPSLCVSWQPSLSVSCQAQPLLFVGPSLCVSRQAQPLRFVASPRSGFRSKHPSQGRARGWRSICLFAILLRLRILPQQLEFRNLHLS